MAVFDYKTGDFSRFLTKSAHPVGLCIYIYTYTYLTALEGQHLTSTTLREALGGNLPLGWPRENGTIRPFGAFSLFYSHFGLI